MALPTHLVTDTNMLFCAVLHPLNQGEEGKVQKRSLREMQHLSTTVCDLVTTALRGGYWLSEYKKKGQTSMGHADGLHKISKS